jgi:hypothetical protein
MAGLPEVPDPGLCARFEHHQVGTGAVRRARPFGDPMVALVDEELEILGHAVNPDRPQALFPECDPGDREGIARTATRMPEHVANHAGAAPITRASGRSRAVVARVARNRRLSDTCYQWALAY